MSKKFIYSLCAGLALVGMASCSNDDVKGPGLVTSGNSVGYAKVIVSYPSSTSRADGGYDYGTADERAIDKIFLGFYDSTNRFVGYGEQISDTDAAETTQDGQADKNVSNVHAMVFKVMLNEGEELPTKAVAFINTDLLTVDLDVLKANYAFDGTKINVDGKKFVMTNSGYFSADNSTWNLEVNIDPEKNIFATEAEATAANTADKGQLTFYVERLAAKITINNAQSIDESNLNYKVVDINGKELKLSYKPTNWAATGKAKQESLVKNQFSSTDLATATWKNKAADFRSYWAEGFTYGAEFTAYYNDGVPADAPLTYVTFGQIWNEDQSDFDLSKLTEVGKHEYVPEHTTKLQMEKDSKGNLTKGEYLLANTYALVTGVYTMTGETASNFGNAQDGFDFYLLLKSIDPDTNVKTYTAYTEKELIEYLLKYNGIDAVYTTEDNDEYAAVEDLTEVLELKYDSATKKYTLVVKAPAEGTPAPTLYKKTSETEYAAINAATDFAKPTNSKHFHYANGAAYFNVPIVHNDGETATYGVVRNHSYVLTITAIENLGAPLDDNGLEDENEETPIIPDPDDMKDHYINAQINVLSWHVITNNAVL